MHAIVYMTDLICAIISIETENALQFSHLREWSELHERKIFQKIRQITWTVVDCRISYVA
jgi:hypothetical protein